MTSKRKGEIKINKHGLSHRAIAKILGISRSRVLQIEQSALKKLRHPKNSRILKTFLES